MTPMTNTATKPATKSPAMTDAAAMTVARILASQGTRKAFSTPAWKVR